MRAALCGRRLAAKLKDNQRHRIAQQPRPPDCFRHELVCIALAQALGVDYGGPDEGFEKGQRDLGAIEVKAIDAPHKTLIIPQNSDLPPHGTKVVLGGVFGDIFAPKLFGWQLSHVVITEAWLDLSLPKPGWRYPRRLLKPIDQLKGDHETGND